MRRANQAALSILVLLIVFSAYSSVIAATPIFTGCPENISATHCDSVYYQVVAVDTSNNGRGNNVRYHLVSGPGAVDQATGLWVYHPELDPSQAHEPIPVVEIAASVSHDTTHGEQNCRFKAFIRNSAPYFKRKCGSRIELEPQERHQSHYEYGRDHDVCDQIRYVSAEMQPTPAGQYSFGFDDGWLTFTPAVEDEGQLFLFTVGISDGIDTNYCQTEFMVGQMSPLAVRIEKKRDVLLGNFADLDVLLDYQPFGIGAFNLLIGYETAALTFQGADEGSLLIDCGWEYFTYRYGTDGNCDSTCPSGMLRFIGIADANNGPNHPDCFEAPTPSSLFSMSFIVSNDRTFQGSLIPVRFFWINCGDNSLSNQQGTELYISRKVKDYDYGWTHIDDIGPADGLLTYLGAPASCQNGQYEATPFIDFQHGGIQIIGTDSIDARGDLNLDGLQYTLTDATWFANYFIGGLAAFDDCSDENLYGYVPCANGSVAASDVNRNDLPLQVADFLYLVSIMNGNASPLNCLANTCISEDTALVNYIPGSNEFSVSSVDTLGALWFGVKGEVVPHQLDSTLGITIDYSYDGHATTIFAYSLSGNAIPQDVVFSWSGTGILSEIGFQAATYKGLAVHTKFVREDVFELRIEQIFGAIQGLTHEIDLVMDRQPFELGGFNMLIGYDASGLSFHHAEVGSLLEDCGWEYFTYRYWADGNCGGGCPSGILKFIGIAEINNGGGNHPDCFEAPTPSSLFSMSFLVSNDRTLECTFIPIRFFWIECGDNTLSNKEGTELYISRKVKDHDYDLTGIDDIGPAEGLESYLGAPTSCLDNQYGVIPFIDFQHGGIHIVCADTIDARGDINLDGISYGVSDLVMFARYFVEGLAVFSFCQDPNTTECIDVGTSVTDVNADQVGFTVADFLAMVSYMRSGDWDSICVGNPCISEDTAYVMPWGAESAFEVNSAITLGAFYCEIVGNVTPNLSPPGEMTVDYRWDGEVTKVFIYSLEGKSLPNRFWLNWNGLGGPGAIRNLATGTYSGLTVPTKLLVITDVEEPDNLPLTFALRQNYPNPFNPSTTIAFDLPEGSPVKLQIFDITGSLVAELFNATLPAGRHSIEWQGRDSNGKRVGSGVYFYRLRAGGQVASKKMLLLK